MQRSNVVSRTLKKAAAIAVFAGCALPALGQFEKTYGTAADERLEWIEQTRDGGYIMTGSRQVNTPGGATALDAYVIRTDASGNVIWDVLVGTQQGFETGHRVIQTADGGFAVAGETNGAGPDHGIYLFKLSPAGVLAWSWAYPGTAFAGGSTGGTGLFETADRGFLVTGRKQLNVADQAPVLIRTDAGGNAIFIKEYTDTRLNQQTFASFSDVHELEGGRIVVSGYTSVNPFPGERDTLLMLTQPNGVPIRANTYGMQGHTDWAREVEPADNGDYILTGYSKAIGEGGGTYLLRVDPSCNLLWYQTFRGFGADTSLIEESSGNILIGGTTSFQADDGAASLQTDASGTYIQSWKYGGALQEFGEHLIPTDDGGYAFAAWTNSYGAGTFDTYLLKLDSGLKDTCEQEFTPDLNTDEPPVLEIPFEFFDREDVRQLETVVRPAGCEVTDPCDPVIEPTDKCHVPWDVKYCRFDTFKDVKVTICNCDTVAHSYGLSFASVPGSGGFFCGVDGPNTFTVLDPLPAVVPAGGCLDICVRVFRPASMAPAGVMGCYDVTFNNLETGNSVTCTGSMISTRRWCPIVIGNPVPVIDIPFRPNNPRPITIGWELVNELDDVSPQGASFSVQVMRSDMGDGPVPFSLNGLPPGEPVTGLLAPTEPFETEIVSLDLTAAPGPTPDVFFDVFFDVILSVDDNGTGDPQPAASQAFRLVPVPACPCDIDGEDGVAVGDLLSFLAGWFASNGGINELLDFLGCWFPASAGEACP